LPPSPSGGAKKRKKSAGKAREKSE